MVTVLILAVSAAILSFTGLRDIAERSGIDPSLSWLFPVIVDGMVLTGSLGVIAADLVGLSTWFPWTLTMAGVAFSIGGNVAAAPPDPISQVVHAIAPATFALSVEGVLRIYRASAIATAQREAALAAKEDKKLERDEKKAEREERRLEREAKLLEMSAKAAPGLAPVVAVGSTTAVTPPRYAIPAVAGQPGADGMTARDKIVNLLKTKPDVSGGQAARELGLDPSYARKILRELRGPETTSGAAGDTEPATA